MTPNIKALDDACEALGTQAALADALGIKSPSISEWRTRGIGAPADRCEAIEAATGITCEQLRPDLDWIRVNGRAFWRNKEQKAA